MFAEVLNTVLIVVLIAGAGVVSVAFIFVRAGARAECEDALDGRIARYAGVNRDLT